MTDVTDQSSRNTKVSHMKSIKAQWNTKMRGLQQNGYREKDLLNARKEEKRLKDLKCLKNHKYTEPFTCKDVSHFMKECKDEKERIDQLYVGVTYAKASSGFGDKINMFRLKDGKNLAVEDYVDQLERYFERAKGVTNISLADLKNILGALEGKK